MATKSDDEHPTFGDEEEAIPLFGQQQHACFSSSEVGVRRFLGKYVARFGVLFAAYLALSAFGVGEVFYLGSTAERWAAAQTIAILGAGAIYLWYTWETVRLRRTAENQLSASVRPVVVALPAEVAAVLIIKNVGSGPALNVRASVASRAIGSDYAIDLRFPKTLTALGQDLIDHLPVEQYANGQPWPGETTVFMPEAAQYTVRLTIEYQSVDRRTYVTHMIFGRKRHEIECIAEASVGDSSAS